MPGKRILLIDDELELVKGLTIILQSEGFEVRAAFDGEEGMKKVAEERPDLIILDIAMPKMDGFTFVKKLSATGIAKRVPIIVLTARAKMKDLFEMEGVKDYVVKPFENGDLLGRVKKLLKEASEGKEA
jgi:two-component system response regulator CpxR